MRGVAQSTEVDLVYMRRALALAQRGWGQTAPNPMVGAVVVAGGVVLGEGYHARYGEAHAEIDALRAAGDRARGATMYVSLEPCAHYGKTPPCTEALIAAGIARAVIAVRDPSAIAGGGIEKLEAAGLHVDLGVEHESALELNAPFFNAHASPRPWVTLKLALSADGRIADPTGRQRWITSPESRAEVHRLRANADAIAVGIGTVLADDPSLTVRDAPVPRVAPRRIVFDSTLRTPVNSALLRTARDVPVTIVVSSLEGLSGRLDAAYDTGATVLAAPSLDGTLRSLRAEDVRSLFVEGGARLAGSLLREALVDRLIIFRSSVVLADAPGAFDFAPRDFESSLMRSRIVEAREIGGDLMTTYALRDVPCSPV